MTDRELLKLALEFIEYHSMYWNGTGSHPQSIVTALREALNEPKTNQCGETCERAKLCAICARGLEEPEQERRVQQQFMDEEVLYLYTPRREWVGLTDEEIAAAVGSPVDEVYLRDFRAVEAKLKEKNHENHTE